MMLQYLRRHKTDRQQQQPDPPENNNNYQHHSEESPPGAVHANYHSFSDSGSAHHEDPLAGAAPSRTACAAAAAASNSTTKYRGFGSSISDLFVDERLERVDCCAVTCCGILQNDRDRFLLQGLVPPSPAKRCVMHAVLPVLIFFSAGMAAIHIRSVVWNQIISTGLILLLAFYFGLQCAKGRWKRMNIRKDLLYAKYQVLHNGHDFHDAVVEHHRPYDDDEDHEDYHPADNEEARRHRGTSSTAMYYYQGQSTQDLGQAHPCCLIGCYAEDRPASRALEASPPSHGSMNIDDTNLARCVYETLCPISPCGQHVQLCGICAIAQEARDVETVVVPKNYTRIDYITMEHVSSYYPAIYRHRWLRHHPTAAAAAAGESGSENPPHTSSSPSASTTQRHRRPTKFLGHPLSQLSHQLVQSFLWFCVCMLLWCLVGPYYWRHIAGRRGNPHMFRYQNFLLLALTFGQSFVFMGLWTWVLARCYCCGCLEFSMDARIKYFASGFFLSASLALFWECAAALVVETFLTLVLAACGVDVMDQPETDASGKVAAWWINGMIVISHRRLSRPWILAPSFGSDNNNDLDAANLTGRPDYAEVFGLDHPVFYTFYIFIATFVVAAFIEEVCKYFGYRMVEHPDFYSRTEIEEATSGLEAHRRPVEDDDDDDCDNAVDEVPLPEDAPSSALLMDYSQQNQSIQNRGAAITLAMVSTAIGFACCENLMYIFFYAGQSFHLQLGVLIERSFFPIHPVLAAIQSIGVCRRDLEGSSSTKLGRIIFPAVCFHGSFDFLIVFLSFLGRLVGQYYEDGDLRVSNTAEFISVLTCVWVMCGAVFYLYNELGKQRGRLAALDLQQSSSVDALPVDRATGLI